LTSNSSSEDDPTPIIAKLKNGGENFKDELKMSVNSLSSLQQSKKVDLNHRIGRQFSEKEEKDRLKLSYAWKIARFSY
jgi:hypothetical protein